MLSRTENLITITRQCLHFHEVNQPTILYFFAILQFSEVVLCETPSRECSVGREGEVSVRVVLAHFVIISMLNQVAWSEILNGSLLTRGLHITSTSF
jgi:hypothetical protein